MAESLPTNEGMYNIDWKLSDSNVIAQMNKLIQALKNKEVEAVTVLPKYRGGLQAAIHIFGRDDNHRCNPEVVSTWLSLLVTLASSEGVTGTSIAPSFPKSCGGCMVYSILMTVGCFHSEKNIQLAFDFFRHVLADPTGEVLELQEVDKLSLVLAQSIPPRSDVFTRAVCLELHCYARIRNMDNTKKIIIEKLCHLVEGIGVLCTSETFLHAMKTNRTATLNRLKESIMNNTFSYEFASAKW